MAGNSNTPFPRNMAGSQALSQGISAFHAQFSVNSSPSASSTPGGGGSTKKVPQKPPPRPIPLNAAAVRSNALAAVAGASRKKQRKSLDKQLPDRVAALLPESALYTQLREIESRIDAALIRKRVDIQESIRNPPFIQRTLRIFVFNTFSNQILRAGEKTGSEPPSWTLKIIGKILEDGSDSDPSEALPRTPLLYPKFSYFFKRITVALDPNLYPENPAIVWENSRTSPQQEGFEIRRKGDKEFTVNIGLEMNHNPEKFMLSPALMDVLGIEVETRPRIAAAIWHYVKAKKLQCPNEPSFFLCDPPLRRVFGEDKIKFSAVLQKISPHLSPPQPIHLEHKIKLSGSSPAGNGCYDVLVDVPFPLQKEMSTFLAYTERHKEIDACDEAICTIIKKIHEHRQKRAFFLGFSQSPVEFINALVASQNRDLKLAAGEASRNAEEERHSNFYKQSWVEDAVIRFLNRTPAMGSDVPAST